MPKVGRSQRAESGHGAHRGPPAGVSWVTRSVPSYGGVVRRTTHARAGPSARQFSAQLPRCLGRATGAANRGRSALQQIPEDARHIPTLPAARCEGGRWSGQGNVPEALEKRLYDSTGIRARLPTEYGVRLYLHTAPRRDGEKERKGSSLTRCSDPSRPCPAADATQLAIGQSPGTHASFRLLLH